MGGEIKYSNKIQTGGNLRRAVGMAREPDGGSPGAGRKKDARYDCSRAIQNRGFAAQVSGACAELMQRG